VQVSDRPGRSARLGAPPSATITVVVVDDSSAQRRYLRTALEVDGDVEVVGEAANGREAVALVAALRPTAVLLDLNLPVMSGLEAIEHIMAASPTPVLVWSAFVTGDDRGNALEALAAGAVDVLPKPGADDVDLDHYAEALRRRVRVASRVRVITHPRGRLRSGAAPVTVLPPASATTYDEHAAPLVLPAARPAPPRLATPPARTAARPVARPAAEPAGDGVRLLVLGASTGGPQAVLTVLSGLPVDLQPAVLVVQHMAAGFVPGPGLLARRHAAAPGARSAPTETSCTPAPSRSRRAAATSSCATSGCASPACPRRPGSTTCPASTSPSTASPTCSGRAPSACC
jgi:two-component system chemotaxis response regulator CheB